MNLPVALAAARRGQLYPAVILYGGSGETRRAAALELGRALLCTAPADERPCGACSHCRRIAWPGAAGGPGESAEPVFHPDFQVLERDLKISTSVEATRQLMRGAQLSPFEARGQVFVVASAESLSGEAANALLKGLEEPHLTAPRHFLLLAPARLDLLPTLRSRSLAVFLGPAEGADETLIAKVAGAFGAAAAAYAETGSGLYLLRAAEALLGAGAAAGWEDPRAGLPWSLAAAAVVRSLAGSAAAPSPGPGATARVMAGHPARAARLALAEALLGAGAIRLRGIGAERILEGLVAFYLVPGAPLDARRVPLV